MGTVKFALLSWFSIVRDVWRQQFSSLSKLTNNISVVSSHFHLYLSISALRLPTVIKYFCELESSSVLQGNHRSPVASPHKGQRCRSSMNTLIYAWTSGSANNRDTGDLRRHYAHYDVTAMQLDLYKQTFMKFNYFIYLSKYMLVSWLSMESTY